MTDQTPAATQTPDEAFGRALVARTTFQQEAVWLPSLAVHHYNAGQMSIKSKTFTDCLIEGPAVMAVMGNTSFDTCNMGVAENPRTLLLKPLGDMIAGVVGMEDCTFVRCRFIQVAFTGSPELLEGIERDLLSARGLTPAEG